MTSQLSKYLLNKKNKFNKKKKINFLLEKFGGTRFGKYFYHRRNVQPITRKDKKAEHFRNKSRIQKFKKTKKFKIKFV